MDELEENNENLNKAFVDVFRKFERQTDDTLVNIDQFQNKYFKRGDELLKVIKRNGEMVIDVTDTYNDLFVELKRQLNLGGKYDKTLKQRILSLDALNIQDKDFYKIKDEMIDLIRSEQGPSFAPEEIEDILKKYAFLDPNQIFEKLKQQNPQLDTEKLTDLVEKITSILSENGKNFSEELEEKAKSFTNLFEEKFFDKFDILFKNNFAKSFGLDKVFDKFKEGSLKNIGESFKKNIGVPIENGAIGIGNMTKGMGSFGVEVLATLGPILLIVGAVAAIGYTLYKSFDVWLRTKKNTIEIQKQFGILNDQAKKFSDLIETSYYNNGQLGFSYEDNTETVTELKNTFQNINNITNDIVTKSLQYQKAFGLTSEEAAKVLDTQINLLNMSEQEIKIQDDRISALTKQYGISGKELKLLLTNTELVSRIGFDNIEKAAIAANKMKLSFKEIESLSDVFELGNFEDGITKAGKLLQFGIKLDPLDVQFKLNEGDIAGVSNDIVSAFTVAGKDISKLRGLERKQLADILGGEDKLVLAQKAQQALLKGNLTTEQKILDIKNASFEDLLNQTSALDKINNLTNTLKRVWESLLSSLSPVFDSLQKGFEEGFRPMLEGMKEASDGIGKELFNKEMLNNIKEIGKDVGKWIGNLITNLPQIIKKASEFGKTIAFVGELIYNTVDSMIIQPFKLVYNIVALVGNLIMGIFDGISNSIATIASPLASLTNMVSTTFGGKEVFDVKSIDKFAESSKANAIDRFKSSGENVLGIGKSLYNTGAQALTRSNVEGLFDIASSNQNNKDNEEQQLVVKNDESLIKETQNTNTLLEKLIGIMSNNSGGRNIDFNQIAMALTKASKM